MKIFAFFGIFLFILLTSCQNRNQVTHNKRKYRKGYYKPNRAKVKKQIPKKREETVYSNNRKTTQKKQSIEEASGSRHSSKNEQTYPHENKDQNNSTDQPPNQIVHQSKKETPTVEKPKTHQDEEEPDDYVQPKTKTSNWVFVLSLIMYLIFGGVTVLSFFIIESAVIILSIVIAFILALIGLNIWNLSKHKRSPENRLIRGGNIAMLILLFLELFAIILIMLLIIILL